MGGSGVIDNFLEVFTRYIDGAFGLLGGEVAFIATTLIVIDVTLAALFWSWGADDDIIARLVKKTLFVGVFAYIIGNWNNLARIVFESFAGLGLKASGTGFSAEDLMRPGRVAQTGLDAARPLLESISDLMGWIAFFENFIHIACLLFAWALVLLAFFILAIQLFITLIEFKLTTLAGFVLIPFGLFGKTAFMAERVLGNVISSGIKVLVLAVIIGIGSTLFSQFTAGFGGQTPTIDDAMAIVLAALTLLGLGIFGPRACRRRTGASWRSAACFSQQASPPLWFGNRRAEPSYRGSCRWTLSARRRPSRLPRPTIGQPIRKWRGIWRASSSRSARFRPTPSSCVRIGCAPTSSPPIGARRHSMTTHGRTTPSPGSGASRSRWKCRASSAHRPITENIYDSPTGRILLVPQGTRIIGEYSNDVGFGQRRVLLVWNRLIFPNGRSIVLERQPGTDTQGYAGLEDGVDYHWLDLAKAAGLPPRPPARLGAAG